MRKATFIKRNTPKWRNYEENPSEPSSDPDELTDRYIELTDDLSYARTFYPDSNVTKYLNSAASRMHRGLMQDKRDVQNRFVVFWMHELPMAFRQSHRMLLISATFFVLTLFTL